MQRALRSVVTSMLLLSMAASLPLASGQTGLQSQETPDQTGHASSQETTTPRPDGHRTPSVGVDSVLIHIDVYGNGTAQWRIEYRVRLDDRTTENTFRRFQRNLREGSGPATEEFHDRIQRSIRTAENTTSRNMSGTDFDVDTTIRQIPERLGVIVYSFQWRGFANVSDRRIRVGDALEGFVLESDERLSITWPPAYELTEVDPAADTRKDTTVFWRGPTTFGPNGPQLHLTSRTSPQSFLLLMGIVAVAALVAVFGLIQRSDSDPLTRLAKRIPGETGEEAELLSNEEQVLRLLEEYGGRVKQQTVMDELDWTPTKTSYVVSKLRDEGQIQSFRLGRENVLLLSDSKNVQKND